MRKFCAFAFVFLFCVRLRQKKKNRRNIICNGVQIMTVYADVLLVTNLFVNYALLACTAGITRLPASGLRMLAGAAVGSLYGLIIFLPELPGMLELIIRIFASALIVLCTFGYKNLRRFLRCFCTFFAVSFAFGGIMFVLWITVAPVGMVCHNGTVYFDINLTVLAISTVVCFAVVSLISRFASRKAPTEHLAQVTVYANGESARLSALIDTGNSLSESFSRFPVCVADATELDAILPDSVRSYMSGKTPDSAENLRLVLHGTVSGGGVLPAFRPDYIEVKTLSKTVKTDRVYIAVYERNVAGGEYGMIINPEIFSEEKRYAETY